MPRPVHFEIHADDPARAIAFYQCNIFGLHQDTSGRVQQQQQ